MMLDDTVSQGIYITDPDGYLLELYAYAESSLWRESPALVANSESLILSPSKRHGANARGTTRPNPTSPKVGGRAGPGSDLKHIPNHVASHYNSVVSAFQASPSDGLAIASRRRPPEKLCADRGGEKR
jgi:hypothetical protein